MSERIISVIIKVFSWTLMGISALLTVLFYLDIITENPFIVWAYLLAAIASVLAIAFPVVFFAMYPKTAVKALLALLLLGSILIVGYLFSDSTPIVSAIENPDFSNAGVLVYSDTGIFATYILFGFAIITLLITGARSILNR